MSTNELSFNNAKIYTKDDQKLFAEKLSKQVLNGDIYAIDFFVKIKSLIETLNLVIKNQDVLDCVIGEIESYGKEIPSYNGATLSLFESGVKYDYSNCGDTKYNSLIEQKKEIDAKIKERESFLKTIKEKITIVDEETGEIVTVHAPSKSSTTTVKTTYKRA